jgi:hypothetical protein
MIGPSYSFTAETLERMDDQSLQMLAIAQAMELNTASLQQTIKDLESFIHDTAIGRA